MVNSRALNNLYLQRKRERLQPLATHIIRNINPEQDTMIMETAEGMSPPTPIHHPYLSLDSWIRVSPVVTTGVKVLQGLPNYDELIQSYYYPNRDRLIELYREGKGLFRPLQQGELEVSSRGIAQTFWSQKGRWESRGGLVNSWLDNGKLEAGSWAPTHRRLLHSHLGTRIKDEERIGVVTRPNTDDPNIYEYPKVDDKFAKEKLFNLNDADDNTLLDFREGHVVEDNGTIPNSPSGNPLRSRKKYYNKEGSSVTIEIDALGNTYVTLPDEAEDGMVINIPNGNQKITIGGDLEVEAAGNTMSMTEDGIKFKAKNGVEVVMDSNGFTVNGHNVVYKEFLDYFGQTHLTSMAIGFYNWQSAHNPSTISQFNIKNNAPGKIKSDSGKV